MSIGKETLVNVLGSPIAYYVAFAKAVGDVCAGVFVSQFFYWYGKGHSPDQWIYKTQQEIESETGLSRRNQETARKRLKELRILEEKLEGLPAKLHYRLDIDRLFALVETQSAPPESPLPDKPVCADQTNQYGGTRHTGLSDPANLSIYTENTTENTTECGMQPRMTPEFAAAQPAPAVSIIEDRLDSTDFFAVKGEPTIPNESPVAQNTNKIVYAKEADPRQPDPFWDVLCWIVGWDSATLDANSRGQVAQTMRILKDAEYSEADLRQFWKGVWLKDWRWTKQKSRPTLKQVRQEIGKVHSGNNLPEQPEVLPAYDPKVWDLSTVNF